MGRTLAPRWPERAGPLLCDSMLLFFCIVVLNGCAVLTREALSLHPNYQFMAISPEWRAEERYLKRRPDAFVVVRPDERDPDLKSYFRELRYYRANEKEPCKILLFYPSGEMWGELDRTRRDGGLKGEGHDRHFDRNGSARSYLHWNDGRWLEGASAWPDGTVDRMTDGHGTLRLPLADPKAYKRTCYHDGRVLTEVKIEGENAVETRLYVDGESLTVTSEEEWLRLRASAWRKRAHGIATFQPVGVPLDVNRRLPRQLRPGDLEKRRLEDAKRYASDRSDFLRRFKLRAAAAGYTLEELGVAALFAAEGAPSGE